MKFIHILILLFLITIVSQAQIKLNETKHDFGQLSLYETSSFKIKVKNVASKRLRISDIKSSSSAIIYNYTQKVMNPGEETEIEVIYHADMIGHFNKALYLYTDNNEKPSILSLTGVVVWEKDVDVKDFPFKIGDVYLNTDNIEFEDVNKGDIRQQVVSIYNSSSKVYTPQLMHLPKYISVKAVPERLMPGRTGKMILTLNGNNISDIGLVQSSVYLSRYMGDNVCNETEIPISVIMLPSFDTTSVIQTSLAPHFEIDSTDVKMPSFGKKQKVNTNLLITNTGRSSLEIRSVQVFNTALGVSLSQRKIAPGATAKLTITINKKYINYWRGKYKVLMITNDAKNPKIEINVALGE